MADLKHDMDDDGDLRDIDPDTKIGAAGSSDSESDDEVADEPMTLPPNWRQEMPDIWLVKLPKSLMEKWSQIKQGGVPLATMRVYTSDPGDTEHKITVHLPEQPQYDTNGESSTFKFNVPVVNYDNQYVFADQPKLLEDGQPAPKKARMTKLVGRVAHKGSFVPQLDSAYEAKVRERNRIAQKRTRNTVMIQDKLPTGGRLTGGLALNDPEALKTGRMNYKMLASGSSKAQPAISLSKKAGKKETERFARMPRNELMDRLQQLFKQRDAWSFKELRAATEQPAEYLKEILQMIAVSPRSGPNTNMWLLNATQKANLEMERGLNAVEEPGPSAVKTEGGVKAEDAGEEAVDDDEDEDEDDEEEFEEV